MKQLYNRLQKNLSPAQRMVMLAGLSAFALASSGCAVSTAENPSKQGLSGPRIPSVAGLSSGYEIVQHETATGESTIIKRNKNNNLQLDVTVEDEAVRDNIKCGSVGEKALKATSWESGGAYGRSCIDEQTGTPDADRTAVRALEQLAAQFEERNTEIGFSS